MLAEERAEQTVSATAGRAIVQILEAEGVRAVFGIPGGHVLDIYEGLHDSLTIRLPVAKVVRPEHPAVGFVGDGSFQMVMQILPVAAEHELPVTWVVLNDNALGSIRDIQELRFEGRMIGTDFTVQPDFAAIARACGCDGERVERSEDLAGALTRALEANRAGRPAVVDVLVAPERLNQTREHYAYYRQDPEARV